MVGLGQMMAVMQRGRRSLQCPGRRQFSRSSHSGSNAPSHPCGLPAQVPSPLLLSPGRDRETRCERGNALIWSPGRPECRRALARGWLIVVRTLVSAVLAIVVAFALWMWWLSSLGDPYASPGFTLAIALTITAPILLTIVVVQAPRRPGGLIGRRA